MKNRRIVITKYGGPSVLRLVEEQAPEPAAGEVRVRVKAAGVAFADVLMREGIYPGAPRLPFTPGYDIVGLVDKSGEGAEKLLPGQLVGALTKVGGYTDYICLKEADLVLVPAGVDPAAAVCLVLNYLTAWQMLYRVAHVEDGDRILVHGAAGGVGTALLELGKLGALESYGTASKAKHPQVSALGGIPIDYRREDFVPRVMELTRDGVDAAFDPIGGENWKRSFKCLRRGGKLVAYGFYGMTRGGRKSLFGALGAFLKTPRYSPVQLIGKCLSVAGYSITGLKARRPDWYRGDLAHLFSLLAGRRLEPVIAQRLPLTEAARAHELLGARAFSGKLVLICGE